MFRTYTLNDDDFSYAVPNIITVPSDCGRSPVLEQLDFVVTKVPEGIDPLLLVEYDEK